MLYAKPVPPGFWSLTIYLGIELGKPWSSEGVRPMYLEEMKRAVETYGATMNQSKFLVGERINGWVIFLRRHRRRRRRRIQQRLQLRVVQPVR